MPMVKVLAVIFTGLYLRGDIPQPLPRGCDVAKVLERTGEFHGGTAQNSSAAAWKIPTPTV